LAFPDGLEHHGLPGSTNRLQANSISAFIIGWKNHWLDGAPTTTRTPDPLITSQVLYQLSYKGSISVM
jgi:hypothetical protein